MKKTNLLFLVILIEGYVVLACELLAIRLLTPFVGSAIDTTAIIISGVLLPLAVGYHFGGIAYTRAFKKAKSLGKCDVTIRQILMRNITTSLVILVFGFSYVFVEEFFDFLISMGLTHPLGQTAVYALLFLVTPMFMLGQTVPLTSHFFSRRKLSAITGRMLFFSTLGAFLGSLFSTLVLMTYLGVHYTVIVTIALLVALGWLVSGKKYEKSRFVTLGVLGLAWVLNSPATMQSWGVVSNNAYNLTMIKKMPQSEDKLLMLNRSFSALYSSEPEHRFDYVKYIEKFFITPTLQDRSPPRDILMLGAGGFSIGQFDEKNNYVYVDIDRDLKDVVEKDLWEKPLPANKKFVAASAREFIRNDKELYDLIVVDVFTMVRSIPSEAITKEFLQQVKARLKKGGTVVSNVIAMPSFNDAFSVRYYNTFASVFPRFNRTVLDNAAGQRYDQRANVLHIFVDHEDKEDATVYTDDKNAASLDVGRE